ncbi:hypothetical protein SDRG_06885 [Saprolegnia diclina VS20]|uniref:RING-type domain-containing protein n=1 Tax=Saprolegnia diclina (strain VS20) TaxID=1156394 RepID=T0RZ37_SAPDV|nr:hypothetical protein SDRG_06885 [Saprolegnia diclina VS20]EQC35597.1 hypothetical protein SDRG_06885 [Saprolegnia diclina VS20]|eukprot:XP_008610914.1 hypothetical protein SDRG_06885 [Saprolegnia diclina VS20]
MAERTDAHEPRWTERGASFLRRINLERVAEDPRVRLLVDGQSTGDISLTSPMNAQLPAPLPPPPSADEPVASWSRALKESISSVLFSKTNDDPILHFSSRLAVLAPPAMQAVTKLFGAKTYTSTWADAQLAMSNLDAAIATRFAEKACVMDCGLLDAVQRTHQKPLVPDTFAGGRVTSLPFKRGAVPSMHSMFVAASTVASWLALDDAHVAILLAPNQEQLSVYLACCAMYRAPFGTDLIAYGERILQWFNENVESAESLALRLSKTFIESDVRNTSYVPGLPRPQARFLRDFTGLLLLRDQQLLSSVALTSLQDRTSLSGAAVLPAQHPLYIHRLSILNLLLRLCDGATDRRAAVVLQLKAGDFDCVSTLYTPHAEFGLLVEFGADEGTFPPEEEPTPTPSDDETQRRSSVLPPRRPPAPALPWTTVATYLVPQSVVYTCYGDGHLTQIDLAVRLAEHTLQFHVQCGDDQARVLSPHQLFGYVLPTAIVDDLRTRRITGIELPAVDGSSRDSFDVQYALWLQRQFDDDTTRLSNEIRIGTSPLEIEALVAQHGTLGLVMLANQLQQADANSRGASDRMIAQLPKRVFSREREGIDIECLVCRYTFESGDDIRTLPCFHSYHTDCIDPWLRLKKVCPTCQVSIELGTAGDGDDDEDDEDDVATT